LGEGLVEDGREELRAAGRAISILIDEIERLRLALLQERSAGRGIAPIDDEGSAVGSDLQASLRARLPQLRRRRRASVAGEEPG
jgi:hypothetical protein